MKKYIKSHWHSWLKSSFVFILGFSVGSFLFRQTQKAFEINASIEKTAVTVPIVEVTHEPAAAPSAPRKILSLPEQMQVLIQPYSKKHEIEAVRKLVILQRWQKRSKPLPVIVKPLLMQLALSPTEFWAVKREAAFTLTQNFFWNNERARNDFILKLDPKIRNTLFFNQRQLVGKLLENQ